MSKALALGVIVVAFIAGLVHFILRERGEGLAEEKREWLDERIDYLRSRIEEGERIGRLDRTDAKHLLSPNYIYVLLEQGDVEYAAELICKQFGLVFATISVEFVPSIPKGQSERPPAGIVHQSDTWEGVRAHIEILQKLQTNPTDLAVVMTHEISHVLLTTLDIRGEKLTCERLTDLACYVCGLGKIAINGVSGHSSFGYLTGDEMVYSYQKVCQDAGISFDEAIRGLKAYASVFVDRLKRTWKPKS